MNQEKEKHEPSEMDELLANPFGSDSIEDTLVTAKDKPKKLVDMLPEGKKKKHCSWQSKLIQMTIKVFHNMEQKHSLS